MDTPSKCRVCGLPPVTLSAINTAHETRGQAAAITTAAALGVALTRRAIITHRDHGGTQNPDHTPRHAGDPFDGFDALDSLDVTAALDRFADAAEETADMAGYLRRQGLELPPGFVGATVKVGDHYIRVKPDQEETQVEVRQAAPVEVNINVAAELPSRRASNLHAGFLYGDAQIGWVLDDDEQWIPTHDPAAIDVALQVLADMEAEHHIDTVTNLGDHLDLPSLSKHRSSPSATAFGSINRSIQSAYEFDAAVSAICPDARKVLVSGNHDERFTLHLIDTSPHLVGLRRAGEDTTPVISVPYLLRHEETGFEMTQAYPNGEAWLSPGIRAVHGPCVRPTNNQTSDKYLADRPDCSTFYGHTHRPGFTQRTFETYNGPIIRVAGSPGCLARVDGVLPSARGGHSPTGRPTRMTEKWGQGVALVFYAPEDPTFTPVVEHVQIRDGVAFWRGREYLSRVTVDGVLIA